MRPDNPRELISRTRDSGIALAALNVNNMETVQAVVAAAEDAGAPVMLQISPGAIDYAGYDAIRRIAFTEADDASVPVLVHLDHCRDADLVRRAVDDGFASVMFDGSLLALDDNVAATRELVRHAHSRSVAVEAELGIIGGSESMTLDDARRGLTTPDEAAAFVAATDVDLFAPALGSLHRMPDDSVTLDLDVLAALASAAGRPLALHGGSGVDRTQIRAAIAAGVGKVNVSSRVGRSFATGIRETWDADPEALDLRRYLGAGRDRVRMLAAEYIALCSGGRLPRAVGAQAWSTPVTEPE